MERSERVFSDLSGVPATMLITLYLRAMETQRPDALIKDEKAVELIARLSADDDFRRDMDCVTQMPMMEAGKVTRILQSRELDRLARDFLARKPDGLVVHIGCGLDSRFERVDNGRVEWYDLDLPEVIALRHRNVRVGAVSVITNYAAGRTDRPLNHGEVEQIAASARDDLTRFLRAWLGLIREDLARG